MTLTLFLEKGTTFYVKNSVTLFLSSYIFNYLLPNSNLHQVQELDRILYVIKAMIA